MQSTDAIAIRFRNGRAIPIEEAFAYADANGYAQHPVEVIWPDGSWSFAKGWWMNTTEGLRLVEVGAGAYGSMRVLHRDMTPIPWSA